MNNAFTPKTFVFLCSTSTEDECIEKGLFGGKSSYKFMADVKINDFLYLYNYKTGILHGKFVAISNGAINIDPQAWGGEFPWQVKVNRIKNYEPVSRSDLKAYLEYKNYPPAFISPDIAIKIEESFKSKERVDHFENDFRNKFPPKYLTTDGHKVRSLGEVTIDNWLADRAIFHGYDRKLPIVEDMYTDFFIVDESNRERIYIEYWGMEDEKYVDRKRIKKGLYKQYNFKLIEINKSDLEGLDDILPMKLRPFLSKQIF